MKYDDATPVYKKDEKRFKVNYRPICSLLSRSNKYLCVRSYLINDVVFVEDTAHNTPYIKCLKTDDPTWEIRKLWGHLM